MLEARLHHHDGRRLYFEAAVRASRDQASVVAAYRAAIRQIEKRNRSLPMIERKRDDAHELLGSHHALREIATLVATAEQPAELFRAVAEPSAQLFDARLGRVVRSDCSSGAGEIVGAWFADGGDFTGQTSPVKARPRTCARPASVQVADRDAGQSEQILEPSVAGVAAVRADPG